MAKGRKGKSSKSKPEASGALSKRDSAPIEKATAKANRGLRKHLKQLEGQLADAAKTEAKRIRRLERARWRRQNLESEVDEAKTASTVGPSEAAPKAKAAAAPKTKAAAAPKAKAEPKPKAAPKAKAEPKREAGHVEAAAVEAYCLREKRRVQMVDPRPVVTAKGGSALSGTCPSCGASLYKLVSRTAR